MWWPGPPANFAPTLTHAPGTALFDALAWRQRLGSSPTIRCCRRNNTNSLVRGGEPLRSSEPVGSFWNLRRSFEGVLSYKPQEEVVMSTSKKPLKPSDFPVIAEGPKSRSRTASLSPILKIQTSLPTWPSALTTTKPGAKKTSGQPDFKLPGPKLLRASVDKYIKISEGRSLKHFCAGFSSLATPAIFDWQKSSHGWHTRMRCLQRRPLRTPARVPQDD